MRVAKIKKYTDRAAKSIRRGSTLMLTLVYVLMFAALASSMVAFSQGNVMVQAADTDTKVALTAAESGMSFLLAEMQAVSLPVISEGTISGMTTPSLLWSGTNVEGQSGNNGIAVALSAALNNSGAWGSSGTGVTAPSGTATMVALPISLDPGNTPATFALSVAWDSGNPYPANGSSPPYLKLHLTSVGSCNTVSRTVTMDVYVQKVLKYAVYSNVAIQLGKNVHVIGDIASTYKNTDKGPPVQMFSDLHFLTNSGNIDSSLATFRGLLATYDGLHVNRLNLSNAAAATAAQAAGLQDVNGDGYIDEWDIAVQKFGSKTDPGQANPWGITASNFTDPTTGKSYDADVFALNDVPMGTSVSPWTGYNDGVIDYKDSPTGTVPAKVVGNIKMAIQYSDWQSAASGWAQWGDTTGGPLNATTGTAFTDQFEGTVVSNNATPVQFGVNFNNQQTLAPSNFSASTYDSDVPSTTAATQKDSHGNIIGYSGGNLTTAMANGGTATEHTPFDVTSGWQATYSRPVFKNLTFNNVRIPKGLNAAFQNCVFNGYTSVKMTTNITDPSTGKTTTDPTAGHSWAEEMTSGSFSTNTTLTKNNSTGYTNGNNLHFTGCTFNGVMTADVPTAYTHFADSWEFDGTTTFANSVDPTVTIMAPNTNIEMGSYVNPGGNPSTLVGVVVAGNIDIRGSANVDGSLIVTGAGAENTTLGYFGSTDQGQGVPVPSQLPSTANGSYGHLFFQLNTSRGMPNGISIPVVAVPQFGTYQIQ